MPHVVYIILCILGISISTCNVVMTVDSGTGSLDTYMLHYTRVVRWLTTVLKIECMILFWVPPGSFTAPQVEAVSKFEVL